MNITGLLLITFLYCHLVYGRPHYFVAAPDIIRYGVDESVVINVFDISNLDIQVYLQDHPNKQRVISATNMTASSGQPYTAYVRLNLADLPSSTEEKRYIFLVVKSTDQRLSFQNEALILLSPYSGYIFIQTDKPLYTPNQEVKIRVIPLDEKRLPSTDPLLIDIKNPQGIIVQRWNSTWEDKFISHTFQLPPIPYLGNNWTIIAAYQNGLSTSASVQFEVTEYVLPRYSVDIDVGDTHIILPTTETINVTVTARFVYGKPVSGEVSLVYGLQADGRFEFCPFRYRKLLENGESTFEVNMTDVEQGLEHYWFPDGARFQIEAEVLETASGRKEKKLHRSIVFVLQPYRLSHSQTRKYFKPGMEFDIEIDTLWPTKTPASQVPVEIMVIRRSSTGNQRRKVFRKLVSNSNGVVKKTIKTSRFDQNMRVVVKTKDYEYEDGQQTQTRFDVIAMSSFRRHYINVGATQIAENINVSMQTSWRRLQQISYIVVSSGHIVKSGLVNRQNDQFAVQFPIEPAMTPKSRIIAYYIKQVKRRFEVIAGSTIVEMNGRCQTTQLQLSADKQDYLPGDPLGMTVNVTGVSGSVVGFVAVDRAVYILRNRTGRLSSDEIYDTYESHDIGCGNGGGRNNARVFQNSGITVLSSSGIQLSRRGDLGCGNSNRVKRSTAEERLQSIIDTHPCCVAGDLFARNATCQDECYEEGKSVYNMTRSTGCAKVFYKCCNKYLTAANCDQAIDLDRSQRLGETQYTFRDINIDVDAIQVRSYFPESWMFEEDYLDSSGKLTKNVALPDSISTHVIQAVSISPTSGLCVADPIDIVTYRDFFVDLDLPYSIVRMEQTEVRATIYNYGNRSLPCHIYLQHPNDICSAKSKSGYIQVNVASNDAETVRFPIIPLKAGEFTIDLTVRSVGIGDRIQKTLLVINEGKEKKKTVSFWLDPYVQKGNPQGQGDINVKIEHPSNGAGTQKSTIDLVLPEEAIPGTGKCKVSATGNIMDSTVFALIGNVDGLLNRIPRGCGEQTMVTLAPIVYALQYLQRTRQITDDLKQRGSRLVTMGYQRELLFRKKDGSFSIWPHKDSSTWLTAFVMKVFCDAQKYAEIDPLVICSGMEYIFSQQDSDGSFRDSHPIYHKEMLGGNIGIVSRTAFALIALLECDCRPHGTAGKVGQAISYLESNLPAVNQVYSLAITTYALALADSPEKQAANLKLRNLAKEKLYSQNGPEGFRYWSVADDLNLAETDVPYWYRKHSSAIDIEVTSYALLAQLELNEINYSNNIVEWLLQQRHASGEFVSTQDTVIALQALSLYNIRTYAQGIDMTSSLTHSSNDTFQQNLVLSPSDVMVEKSIHNVPVNGKLNISTEGSGVARMDVEVLYNVDNSEHDSCKFMLEIFDTDVQLNMLREKGYTTEDLDCDVCGYCTQLENDEYPLLSEKYNVPDLNPRMRGTSRLKRSMLSNHGASKPISCLEVCVSYLGFERLDMPIVDIGLPTGFRVKEEDLQKMKDSEKIDNFEISKRSVTLYLENIPSDEDLCFKFRVVKEFEVENLQAAKIEVYDFYKEDERCVKFYSLRYEVADLDIFCSRDDCHCVEGKCAESWDMKLSKRQITRRQLYQITCNQYDFVIRINVTNIVEQGNHMLISTTVESVIRPGKGNIQTNEEVEFWMNLRCDTDIEIDHFYIVYGNVGIKYIDYEGNERYRYYIQGDTAIMKDYIRTSYRTNAEFQYWGRYLSRMERYIKRYGCQ